MTEQELNDWGTSADLDTTTRIYQEAGLSYYDLVDEFLAKKIAQLKEQK